MRRSTFPCSFSSSYPSYPSSSSSSSSISALASSGKRVIRSKERPKGVVVVQNHRSSRYEEPLSRSSSYQSFSFQLYGRGRRTYVSRARRNDGDDEEEVEKEQQQQQHTTTTTEKCNLSRYARRTRSRRFQDVERTIVWNRKRARYSSISK